MLSAALVIGSSSICMQCQNLFSGKNKKKYESVVSWIGPAYGKVKSHFIQSTLVISNSKGLTETLRDIGTSTYQSWESEENNKLNNHI